MYFDAEASKEGLFLYDYVRMYLENWNAQTGEKRLLYNTSTWGQEFRCCP